METGRTAYQQMRTFALWVAVVGTLLPGVAGGAVGNEVPLADAGLDQTATVGETVRLDAAGSRDPDGAVRSYEWTLTAPNGSTVTPACRDCATTTFTPLRRGEYAVTVTVTDDDGATRADTLYVTVDSGEGPAVSVSGQTGPSVGESATYTADATAGNVPLDRITWTVDGSDAGSEQVTGDEATVDLTEEFDSADSRRVAVTVTDVAGQEATDSLSVEPTAAPSRAGGGGGGPEGYYDTRSGLWLETDDSGAPSAPTSAADTMNLIKDNGVDPNIAKDFNEITTTSDISNDGTADAGQFDSGYETGSVDGRF